MNFTLPGGFSMPSWKLLIIIGVVGVVVGLGLILFSRWWNYCPGCHGEEPFNSLSSGTPSKTATVASADDSETSEQLAPQAQEEDRNEENDAEDGGIQGIHSGQDYSPV